ncbi:MAG: AbrB/MazE/SpoVT family DNA-binding domain-containing protein [Gaiellales bacterium]
MAYYRLTVGDRGRIVLPAAMRRACGIDQGHELIAAVDDAGRISIDTRGALLDKLRNARTQLNDASGVDSLREWRETSDAERFHRLEHPTIDPEGADERGRQLLQRLGLDG